MYEKKLNNLDVGEGGGYLDLSGSTSQLFFQVVEPLLGQIQIAKAATYAKRCAKMSIQYIWECMV